MADFGKQIKRSGATKDRIYPCPRCRVPVVYDVHSSHRPFCSNRCKDGDIISWAAEEIRIPGQGPTTEEELIELERAVLETLKPD